MGIDVDLRWSGQTEKDKKAQITGFSVVSGHVGYLRKAYHGEPYVTRFLFPEAFATGRCRAWPKKLRKLLPRALEIAEERDRVVYGYDHEKATAEEKEAHVAQLKAFEDFVSLVEQKVAEKSQVWIEVSA